MDEYQLEIQSIRRTLGRLRAERAAAEVIAEYEDELRNLQALHRAALETLAAGEADGRLRSALRDLGFGPWTLGNVYSFVYEATMDADLGGRGIAQVVRQMDFAGTLLAAAGD